MIAFLVFTFLFLKKRMRKPQHNNSGTVKELNVSFGVQCGVNVRLLQPLSTFISPKNVVFLQQIQWHCVFQALFWLVRGQLCHWGGQVFLHFFFLVCQAHRGRPDQTTGHRLWYSTFWPSCWRVSVSTTDKIERSINGQVVMIIHTHSI